MMQTEREPGTTESLLQRLLGGLVGVAHRRPFLVLAVALALCGASVYYSSRHLSFRTQRSDLISPDKDYQKRWRAYLAEFGDDDDMVVVVQGADRAAMRAALDGLAECVAAEPELFDRLFYKVDLRALRNRALLLAPAEKIAEVQNNLKDMRELLDPSFLAGGDALTGWKLLTLASLLDRAATQAQATRDAGTLSEGNAKFFGQLTAIARSAAAVLDDPEAYENPWHGMVGQGPDQQDLLAEPQYFFSPDGSLAFLLVRPVKETGSFTSAQKSVDRLRELVKENGKRFPNLSMGLTGLPVLENDEMVASQSDTNTASWLALAGVAILYLLVFRGFRYPLLTVGTLLVGTAWAMGWLTLTVGHLNILSATFAVMLIGMGDYGVLWISRYEQERQAGASVAAALRTTSGSVGLGILTAGTTTALSFYAAMLADFQAVAELGWIAGSGVLLCAFSCFTVLPALLRLVDRRDRPRQVAAQRVKDGAVWLPGLATRPRLVIGVSLVLTAVLAFCATRIPYDHNLLHLQAAGLDSVEWEMTLIKHTAGASWHALSYTDTREEALVLKARYEQLPGVSRVVEFASLVPTDQDAKLECLKDIQHRLRRLPARDRQITHAPPDVAQLDAQLTVAIAALRPLSEGPAPLLDGALLKHLRAFQGKLSAADPGAAKERLATFETRLTHDLVEDLHRLKDVSTPEPIAVGDLPACVRERYIGKSGKWLLQVFAKDCLWDYGPLKQFVEQVHSVDPEATGKPFSTLEGLRSMKHGFLWAGLYALIAMVVVLLLDFRNVKHMLVALAPMVMGMGMSLGIMVLCGVPLNPANMIAFPLILGVGIDNGVHVLHDYFSRRRDRSYLLGSSTGRGIMVAALTTILGFGTLMLSHHRGLASLGLCLTLGVTCCMLTALVFLPAVLRLLSIHRLAREQPATLPMPAPQEVEQGLAA
jgi:hopanoid biosynthesis associated RND transporter like protein HpnN